MRRFVHVGTEAALLAGQPLVNVDETAPLRPDSPALYSSTKAKAEQLVLEANRDGFDTVVVRPRFVWGRGDTTLLPTLAQMVRSGRWAWIGGGRHRTSTTHVDNTVQGLVLGADRGRPGNAYFVTDGDPIVFRDFVTRAASNTRRRAAKPRRAGCGRGRACERDRGCVACAPASRPAAAHPLRLLGRFTGVHDQDRQGTQGPRLLTGNFPGGGTHGAALGATRPRHTLSTTALLTLLSGVMPTLDSLTPPHRSSSPNVRRRRPIL